ncbi:LOW QUALITY PROTEIN: hypothetical protein V2J09_002943 [Rumex salicifolius]
MHDGIIRMMTVVRHIPALKKNLISLGTLHVNGFDYKSDFDCVKVSKGAMTVMKGQITPGRVYRLIGSIVVGGATAAVSESGNTTLCHLRMGHIREHDVTELHKRGLLTYLKSCKMGLCKFCVMGEAAKKAIECKWIFKNVEQGGVQLHYGSQNALILAKNQVYHVRTKHINVKFHKIRELATSGEILLERVHTLENLTDMLTKPVTVDKFKHCLDLIHVF